MPERDTLGAAITTTSATSVTLTTGTEITKGGVMDFYEDGSFEALYIASKESATAATVARGWFGTTAATHLNGAAVLYNPRHISFRYREAVNAALNAISAAFGKQTWASSESFSDGDRLISVPATAIRVFAVREKVTGETATIDIPFSFEPSVATGIVSTGKAVQLTSYNPGTGTAYVGYETNWGTLSALADNLDSTFPADAEDLILLGAMAYLTDAEAFRRVAFGEPHAFRAEGVSTSSDVERSANLDLQKFLVRRSEVGARPLLRRHNWAWVK